LSKPRPPQKSIEVDFRPAYVAYAVHDKRKSLQLVANVGGNARTFDAANFTWNDSELGHIASATAIRTGQPVVARRLLTDPASKPDSTEGRCSHWRPS